MGNEPNRIVRWAKMAANEIVWSYETIKETGSEELNYIIELITGGHGPGRAIPDERTKDTNSNR